ncbi:MAG: hypothetical protein AAFR38_05705 [Planctomycetota bacterium]
MTGETVITADWADVPAALEPTLTRCACAVVETVAFEADLLDPRDDSLPSAAPPVWGYELRVLTLEGQEGTLSVRRLGPLEAVDPVEISIAARVGPFGAPAIERCLVESLAHRLGQLRGVGAAELSWPD